MADERATGRDVILAIAENMRASLEPLITRTVAPSLYQVYLHAGDYDRLHTLFGDIETEARELLDRELAQLNRPPASGVGRLVKVLRPRRKEEPAAEPAEPPRFYSAEGRWFIRFQEDPNSALEPGDVQVVSEFAQRQATGYGAGNPTHRISTTRRLGGQRVTSQRQGADPAAAYAHIRYKDDSGAKEFWVAKDEIVIGRDAPDVWVDLRLETSLDVSREHARLRRSPDSGAFRIKDLSKLGTTVNGQPVPSSLEAAGDTERDLDRWSDLPDQARIGLAGIVFLDFERVSRP